MSTIVYQLFQNYQSEKIDMPYTMEDFQKDFVREHLDWLSPDDRLRGLSPGDRLRGLSPDDIVNDLSPADLEKRMAKLQKNRNRKK
ncbi:MAG: hypothetical protein ACRERV_11145 [Methylococcales bacterium]